jgi:hypothetical protein
MHVFVIWNSSRRNIRRRVEVETRDHHGEFVTLKQDLIPELVPAHLDEEGGYKRLRNRLVQHREVSNWLTA